MTSWRISSKRWLSSNGTILSRRPVKKLSRQSTSCPSFSSRSQRCEPIKPAPPVTRIRIVQPFGVRWQAEARHRFRLCGDSTLDEAHPKRRRRSALPAHSKISLLEKLSHLEYVQSLQDLLAPSRSPTVRRYTPASTRGRRALYSHLPRADLLQPDDRTS